MNTNLAFQLWKLKKKTCIILLCVGYRLKSQQNNFKVCGGVMMKRDKVQQDEYKTWEMKPFFWIFL